MDPIFDLAIIGGGPAGAAAAIEARRQGLSVAVFDGGHFPRDKVCGEFISGESLSLLRDLIPIEAARGIEIRCSAFISRRGRARVFPLPQAALGLSRRVLDEALWRAAMASGACCREGVAVQSVRRPAPTSGRGAGWAIEAADGSISAARHLILACGRWWAIEGLPSRARSRDAAASPWVGFKAHFSGIAASDAVEMFYFPGGYCGLAPVEGGATNVCCLVHRDLVRGAARIPPSGTEGAVRDFRSWLARAAQSPALDSRLRSAVQITETVAAAPIHLARGAPTVNGASLIGDASGFIDPFTGGGISIALQTGTIAARVIARCQPLEGNRVRSGNVMTEYSAAMRPSVERCHAVAGILRKFISAPALAQELASLALPFAGPALVRATRFRAANNPILRVAHEAAEI